ncbi:efflux RND transporter permease subunit [Bacillus sp. HMF5848]|uniref:efflux RND transporter permease subunit n=1 Tax=Bacillus sp. HMF5848 TaxID=2495421 RepID=UPI000F78C7C2|nr:efflux RND transporter permease subunit [Bacillus sp. HMF5848]RSK26481.1 efflux RND transporter permease subunit [Bacillus sp. HMF5848]
MSHLAKLAVMRPVAMTMVIIFMLIIGMVSVKNIAVDLFPDMTFPVAVITTNYEGAGPEEIEALISDPLENMIGTIPNVESISSISQTGTALIIVSFVWGTNMDVATLQIREKIDMAREYLPNTMALPRVMRFNPSDFPIIQLAVTTDTNDMNTAKLIANDEIKTRLQSVKGIAAVYVEGGREKEIKVNLNQTKLLHHGVTLETIQQIIASENLNIPSGQLRSSHETIPIRVTGQFTSVYDVMDIQIPTNQGLVKLKDLAQIEEGYAPINQISLLNNKPAVGITVYKQSGANTVEVTKQVQKTLEKIQKTLPSEYKVTAVFEQSKFINQSLRAVLSNILTGSGLAAVILFVFLKHFRSTVIIFLAIPLSIVTTFVFLFFSKQTLNVLTLGGLALGVGMMVDNAIVILENIYRYRQLNYPMKKAAIMGSSEIGTAIIASTLTTIIVFLPFVFVNGLAAQLFKPLAQVIAFSLLASLFTALIIVPLFASLFLKLKDTQNAKSKHQELLKNKYKAVLEKALNNRRVTIFSITLLFILSFVIVPFLGTEFLPAQDQSMISIEATLPPGHSIDQSLSTSETIVKKLATVDDIDILYTTIGGNDPFTVGARSQSNKLNYTIMLTAPSKRDRSDVEIADTMRQLLKDIPSIIEAKVSASDTGFAADPVSLKITGPNLQTLQKLAEDVRALIVTVEGVRELDSNFSTGNPLLSVAVFKDVAYSLGIGSMQLAKTISDATQGIVASQFTKNGEELPIRLVFEENGIKSQDELENMLIKTQMNDFVPLKAIASFTRDNGPTRIIRTNRMREISLTADVFGRDIGSVNDEIESLLRQHITLPDSRYKITFGGQDEQMNDAFFKLTLALLLAVVLVYMVMAGQFESFFYPFIIMFSVPLTLIGILIGLLITNQPIGVGSLIGLLILTGIVVNNAIVLVDYINQLKVAGHSTREAILEACPTRLRPILMTAFTTILGLLPLSLGLGEGTEVQQPMAIVIISGLLTSTCITLLFIPVLYESFDKKIDKKRAQTN